MSKEIPAQKINSCWDCNKHGTNSVAGMRQCWHSGKPRDIVVEDIVKYPIPSWCPLPDYKEPLEHNILHKFKGDSDDEGTMIYDSNCSACNPVQPKDNLHSKDCDCSKCKYRRLNKPKEPQVENPYTRYYNDPDSPDGKSETTLYRVWQEGYEAGRRSK